MDKLERKTKMRRLERAALIVLATLGLGALAIWGFIEGRPLRANFVGLASLWLRQPRTNPCSSPRPEFAAC
jgi:hypothetical protein